ncbi:hypothetical protein IQ270_26780 [Microcoleus sp. LEGE 07076]|nr:hypothetical protein [Microcoleus sp. LEGE 07076]MBE9188145.1 hypothetical protein [Microcoleus sp. LEGE 07076]
MRLFVKISVDASIMDIRNLGNFAGEPQAIGYKLQVKFSVQSRQEI